MEMIFNASVLIRQRIEMIFKKKRLKDGHEIFKSK